MSENFSALEASRSIRSAYKEYLLSAFDFSDSDIKQEFRRSLEEQFEVSKGPFIQATPPYLRGKSLRELAADGIVCSEFVKDPPIVSSIDRPLYHHQVQAIQKIAAKRNVIIATGTGSGKTESFLFPILDALLREREAGTLASPGVRALLLYPMNALANDQLARLRELLENVPDVTFGRFTGDTGWDDEGRLAADYTRRYGVEPLPNEMLSRERMRITPPHVLVTNFAMLEYLLLRPAETNFFDGPTGQHWKFIVLDEVHTYQGAKGGEIRMLLKRLRDRIVASSRRRITFIGTSATIGSDESDMPKLAKFAGDLFDENVEYQIGVGENDIIRPRYESRKQFVTDVQLSVEEIKGLHHLMSSEDESGIEQLLLEESPLPSVGESIRQRLGGLLARESAFQQLQRALDQGPAPLDELVRQIVSLGGSEEALAHLIDLAKFAETPGENYPLLSARYHMFLRALEGMFYCFNPDHPEKEPRLSLDPRDECSFCSTSDSGTIFEIGPCMQCGATYIIGNMGEDTNGPKVTVPGPFNSNAVYLTPLLSEDAAGDPGDEDEEVFAEAVGIAGVDADIRTLCTACGALDEHDATCSHQNARIRVLHTTPKDADSPLRRCVVCSHQSNSAVVNRVQTGQDAPAAILASSIYQELPSEDRNAGKVGGGRKLLCFSDSRQDAAFFAPYLERTYMRNVQRRILLDALGSVGEPVRFEDLIPALTKRALNSNVLSEDDEKSPDASTRMWLLREALNIDGRQSLVGTGLLRVRCRLPQSVGSPNSLRKAGFDERESSDILQALLASIRDKSVIDVPLTVDISDPIFSPRNVVLRMRETSDGRIVGWSPKPNRVNTRLDYLARVLGGEHESENAREVLSDLWSELTTKGSPWAYLFSVDDVRGKPALCLNYKMFEFELVRQIEDVFECSSCKRVAIQNIRGACPRYRCKGVLRPAALEDGKRARFRSLYSDQRPIGMRVEEHTGQLSNQFAADIQQGFVDGNINTLSCSTTFELGVDLGEIQAVLMKNVPPSAANYAQRAGRAGRRTSSTALVTTFAQRRSHDLSYFANPSDLVNGVVQAPQISVTNTLIIRRHIHAVAFAAYARYFEENGGDWPKTVGEFFQDSDSSGQTIARNFETWLRTRPVNLGESISRIIDDPSLAAELGVESWGWVDDLYSEGEHSEKGWLRKAELVVVDALSSIDTLISEKGKEMAGEKPGTQKAKNLSKSIDRLQRQAKTIRDRRLIDFLAQRVVLPKYGFPVDVASLDIWTPQSIEGANVDLSRDLQIGILDFAPGSQTVANKRIWEANGLRIPPDKALPEFHWRICKECDTFRTLKNAGNDTGCEVCGSFDVQPQYRPAIVPAFGFLGKPSEEKPGESRPPKIGTLRSFFTEFSGQPPDEELVRIGSSQLSVRVGKEGVISVINQGPRNSGFEVCLACGGAKLPARRALGRTAAGQPTPHKRPGLSDHECKTIMKTLVLGHQFRTDAIEVQLPGRVSYESGESVLAALLAATQKLDIPRDDVKGTTRASAGGQGRALVIYDAVPGGAGYARALREALPQLFEEASRIVNNCGCGEETSCYGCLRSYSNQFVHDRLSRRAAMDIFSVLGIGYSDW